jgi:CRISPR/Cas system-associated endonuclease Cas1
MATLYLTEQGATLRKEQNRLVVERDGERLAAIHDFKVERVVVGNVQVTTQAVSYLLDRGIDTAFLSQHGRLKGRLAPTSRRTAALRRCEPAGARASSAPAESASSRSSARSGKSPSKASAPSRSDT